MATLSETRIDYTHQIDPPLLCACTSEYRTTLQCHPSPSRLGFAKRGPGISPATKYRAIGIRGAVQSSLMVGDAKRRSDEVDSDMLPVVIASTQR